MKTQRQNSSHLAVGGGGVPSAYENQTSVTKPRYAGIGGPWDAEPDTLNWTDEKTGYDCHICRGPVGAFCGYVRVPEGHPLHNIAYNATLPESQSALKNVVMDGTTGKRGVMDVFCLALGGEFHAGMLFDVHGGITFSGDFAEGGFWYGFDCSHCDDLAPAMSNYGIGGEYRDIEYVKAEVLSLAKQLKQVQG